MSKSRGMRAGLLGAGVLLLLVGQAGCGGSQSPTGPAAVVQPAPRFAQTVALKPISGKVMVEVPSTGSGAGGQKFVPVSSSLVVSVGTVVDATAGDVRLTVATPAPTQLRTGEFRGGIFEIAQPSSQHGLAVLRIYDNLPRRTSCPATRGKTSQRILGLLRGTASQGFQTAGQFSAATVRGTEWGVRDRCDGTFTVVTSGEVVVRVFRLQKNILLRSGQTFLASAR